MRLVLLYKLVRVLLADVVDSSECLQIPRTLFLLSLLRREEGRERRERRIEYDSLQSGAVVCSSGEEVEGTSIESAVAAEIETTKVVVVVQGIRQNSDVWVGE